MMRAADFPALIDTGKAYRIPLRQRDDSWTKQPDVFKPYPPDTPIP